MRAHCRMAFPGVPTAEGIKNFLEYDIKIPLQIKEDDSSRTFVTFATR